MSILFNWTGNPAADNSVLQRESCQLISNYCQKFKLDEDIEFACFELVHKYLTNLPNEIIAEFPCIDGSADVEKQLEDYVKQAMFAIDLDLPLNLLSIISITAKYFGAKNWSDDFKMLPELVLQATGRVVSYRQIYHMEFGIFRNLGFCIKRSAPSQTIQTILEYCSNNISPSIADLNNTCTKILRFTYIEQQIIFKKAFELNSLVGDYIVNATFIASVVVFASATYDKFNDLYSEDILELIKVRTGFSDNIMRNFAQAILSEFNKESTENYTIAESVFL